ncbi:MAG: zinc ABC transporter substrate-binding protein [Nitrospirae bacterium]|nr:zinc ABC transporter substrate-binding protein [Nitrospirota bacterium]
MTIRTMFLSVALLSAIPSLALAKVQVVTTTEDLSALAREVGGDWVDATPIARGYQDPHFVEAKPSYLLKLKRADLYIQVGLELEVGWATSLLTNARNPRILPGNMGFMDASEGCNITQRPEGRVDRSLGDVHPLGNPHYWLDPGNGRIIARSIAQRLAALDRDHAKDYVANFARFEVKLAGKEKEWDTLLAPYKGVKVVTYHNSWPNFAGRFGLNVVNYIEPKPGIPPSPAHIHDLIEQVRSEAIPLVLVEPYFDPKLPEKVAREGGATFVVFPPSVGGTEEIKTYFDLFDAQVRRLREALENRG